MVYAYGPESPDYKKEVKIQDVIAEIAKMKEYGFNTLNLYGDMYLDDILVWCEQNNMAFYPRTNYTGDEYPDFMDSEFRNKAKHSYDEYLKKIKKYRCVLAIDMDMRWMFKDSDWIGRKHPSLPGLGKATVAYFPQWLKTKYVKISQLNRAWKKRYTFFEDAIMDAAVVEKDAFLNLGVNPWRNDVFEYTHWVINDFLKDLTAYMRSIDPNHLITYTTELPEPFNFPVSTLENSGIDFTSPVHYNSDMDYGRDWISLAKLLLQCKFHADLYGTPVYISESGWRTKTLMQRPPSTAYAMAKIGDENQLAELYLRQNAAIAALPFLTGWSYFKWFDKWFEGDFGFINDNGSDKPISRLGKVMNQIVQVNNEGEKEPELYIYYPSYNFASTWASFSQHKTAVVLLEYEFMTQFDLYCNEVASRYVKNPSQSMKSAKLFTDILPMYKKTWLPFKFVSGIPDDNKPVLLAGRSLEQLTEQDRKKLSTKRTITFGEAGIYNETFEETPPWYLEAVGINPKMYETKTTQIDISGLLDGKKGSAKNCLEKDCEFQIYENGKDIKYVRCSGQSIKIDLQSFTKLQFLAASSGVNICDKVVLKYSDGSSDDVYLGPTVPSWSEEPAFGHLGLKTKIGGKKAYIAHISDLPVNPMKKLAEIKLPDQSDICIFAISANGYGVVRDCFVTVDFNGNKIEGITPWMLCLRGDIKEDFMTLARFANGSPAIVQSKDGKHIAYLYDPLTWEGTDDEISRLWGPQSSILKQLIKELK
ncbi:MAG: hypothetical protein ABII64_10080 [Elusimicrobiota bacterium]